MTFTPMEIVLIVAAFLAVLAGLLIWSGHRRTHALKSRFGPEYSRAVHDLGDERKAEAALVDREKRVASYTIRPLPSEMKDHFIQTWQTVQAQFVDDPKYAVTRADDLLSEVMLARGYPMHDFDGRADDLSVDHPNVVQNYRAGHEIALRHSHGEASTEDLRAAMIYYRDLFQELVEDSGPTARSRGEPAHH